MALGGAEHAFGAAVYAGHRALLQPGGEGDQGLHREIETVTNAAHRALTEGDEMGVGELMTINHALLAAIGVSTPALDHACSVARAAGALGAKLTGAGGGGSIVVLASGSSSDIRTALTAAGCQVVEGGGHA